MLFGRIKQSLLSFIQSEERIMNDNKIKTFSRKKLKILDEWHLIWELNIRQAVNQYELALYKSYYGMYTSTVANGFQSMDELDNFIHDMVHNQIIGVDYMEKERDDLS